MTIMSATAEAVVERHRVLCSRCGALMEPESLSVETAPEVPLLRWRCPVGHHTQLLPLPDAFRGRAIITPPRLNGA